MISSFQNKRALLIGNGVNQLDKEQSISWHNLLEVLKVKYSISVDLDNDFKPFPLGFEEMLHRKDGSNAFENKLKILKKGIRNSVENQLKGKLGYNDFHKKIMQVGYNDVLTTNYDYSLEKSIEPDFFLIKDDLAQNKQEIKYSLKRCYKLKAVDTKVWHIHGELFDSRNLSDNSKNYNEESIMIGYEHYTSYLEKIQENFKGKSGVQKDENKGLMIRLKGEKKDLFWTDIFFTHNIDIIGQGFDFSENHLWWLINQRANYIKNYSEKYGVLVDNEIKFYYPFIEGNDLINVTQLSSFDNILTKRNSINKSKAIAEVLEAFKVIQMPIVCASYDDFYNKLFNENILT